MTEDELTKLGDLAVLLEQNLKTIRRMIEAENERRLGRRCAGVPSIGVEPHYVPHSQVHSLFTNDSYQPQGMSRCCRNCQRKYRQHRDRKLAAHGWKYGLRELPANA